MGIDGLIAANGMSEAVTGKDMFGNQLTEEQGQNSLLTALGIGGTAGAGYTFDRLASRNAMYNANNHVNSVVANTVTKDELSKAEINTSESIKKIIANNGLSVDEFTKLLHPDKS